MTIDERSGKYAHEITENSTAGGKDHHLHHFDFCSSYLPVSIPVDGIHFL